jgi:hypothetical protein
MTYARRGEDRRVSIDTAVSELTRCLEEESALPEWVDEAHKKRTALLNDSERRDPKEEQAIPRIHKIG